MSRAKCEQRMTSVINYYKNMTIENFIAQTTQLFETTDYIRNENEKWKDNIDISRVHRYDDINEILSDMFVKYATTHNNKLNAVECINWFDKSIIPMTATFKLKKLKKLADENIETVGYDYAEYITIIADTTFIDDEDDMYIGNNIKYLHEHIKEVENMVDANKTYITPYVEWINDHIKNHVTHTSTRSDIMKLLNNCDTCIDKKVFKNSMEHNVICELTQIVVTYIMDLIHTRAITTFELNIKPGDEYICLQGIRGNENWQRIKQYLEPLYKAYRTITSDLIGVPVYTAVFVLSTIAKQVRRIEKDVDKCPLHNNTSDAYCGVTYIGDSASRIYTIISYDGNINVHHPTHKTTMRLHIKLPPDGYTPIFGASNVEYLKIENADRVKEKDWYRNDQREVFTKPYFSISSLVDKKKREIYLCNVDDTSTFKYEGNMWDRKSGNCATSSQIPEKSNIMYGQFDHPDMSMYAYGTNIIHKFTRYRLNSKAYCTNINEWKFSKNKPLNITM